MGCPNFSEFYGKQGLVYLSHITKKPVFGVCDQLRLKPASAATEAS